MQINEPFSIPCTLRLRCTSNVFDPANPVLAEVLRADSDTARAVIFVDDGLAAARPDLLPVIQAWAKANTKWLTLPIAPVRVPGGEIAKNDRSIFDTALEAIDRARLCRRSYVIVVGGGATLDVVGFAAAIAHRGVRLVRLPSTTLSQGDSGVGVKNGVNAFGRKNYLGCFAVPHAVINDAELLTSLSDRDWRCGFSEAVKVGIVKDASLFERIEANAALIAQRRPDPSLEIINASALLHLRHITQGGDPFETTSLRPLDFGHWSAHRMEALSAHAIRHGEAVAIGIAIDVLYAARIGTFDNISADRVVRCLETLGFSLTHPLLADADEVLDGIEEFREHLGGPLTISLPVRSGTCIGVHEIDVNTMRAVLAELLERTPIAKENPR